MSETRPSPLAGQRERGLIESAQREAAALPGVQRPSWPQEDSLPGYRIRREIHRGGQGVVYEAVQQSTQRNVAIKVMHEGPFSSPRDQARFEREVHILGQLKHPNIVAVHDSGLADGHFYFVMDFIPGQPLDLWMMGRPRDIRETLQPFARICEAVNAAHLRGIIHRDLKPGNIRVDADDQPHILDFGLAKIAPVPLQQDARTQLTASGQFLGSLPWASPEQAQGSSADLDIRSDVYSLGVILHHMLTGRYPYDVTGNLRDVIDNILRADPTRPSSIRRQINDELDTIVLKCLRKEPQRRYQSAGELGRDIRHYLNGDPIEAKRDSAWYVLRKKVHRHRAPLLVVGVLAVLLCIAGQIVRHRSIQDQAAGLVARGRELEDRERYSEALASYDEALRLVPDCYEAIGYKAYLLKEEYFNKPFGFRDQELLGESLRLCEQALDIKPQAAGLWNLKAVLLTGFGMLQDAEDACRHALTLKPEYYYAASNLAKVLALQHRFDEAIQAIREGIEVAVQKTEKGKYDDGIWRTLATLQLTLSQEEARSAIDEALRIEPEDARNHLILARYHLLITGGGDPEAALEAAKDGHSLTPRRDPRFSRILAQAHLVGGQFEDAARHARAAIEDADLPSYGRLILAIAEARMNRPEDAVQHLRDALDAWPEPFDHQDIIVTAEKGLLWFETRAELLRLRDEAERLLDAP